MSWVDRFSSPLFTFCLVHCVLPPLTAARHTEVNVIHPQGVVLENTVKMHVSHLKTNIPTQTDKYSSTK